LILGKEENLWIATRAEQSRSIAINQFYNEELGQKRQLHTVISYKV